jgi:flavin reductase (DIM6/NTAB) family NADH-FMN oxidoreductase RutF
VLLDPATESPANLYKVLIGSVVPRPIAFVSTTSAHGVSNLAPFSFFTVASADPPVLCFAPMVPPASSQRRKKDTLANIEATGEFVVNIVSEDFARQMNVCSGEYPPDVDEFKVSGLTPIPSERVRPPRVAESRVQYECRLHQIVTISTNPMGGSLVLGEIVLAHIDEAIIQDYRIDADALRAIGRMGGTSYARTRDRFDLARPR